MESICGWTVSLTRTRLNKTGICLTKCSQIVRTFWQKNHYVQLVKDAQLRSVYSLAPSNPAGSFRVRLCVNFKPKQVLVSGLVFFRPSPSGNLSQQAHSSQAKQCWLGIAEAPSMKNSAALLYTYKNKTERMAGDASLILTFSFSCVVSVKLQEGQLVVCQFQFLRWSAYRDVPDSKKAFLNLLASVQKWQRECGEGRTVVHCLWVTSWDCNPNATIVHQTWFIYLDNRRI